MHGLLDDFGHTEEATAILSERGVHYFVGRIEDARHVTALFERSVGQCQTLELIEIGLEKLQRLPEKVEPIAIEMQTLGERKGILDGQTHIGHA